MRLVDPARGEARSEPERLADKRQCVDRERRRLLRELLFDVGCNECNKMAAIPQGAFAAIQVRKNFKRLSNTKYEEEDEDKTKGEKNYEFNSQVLQEGREPTPLKYNSKLMNSIWGLYNRYSVHNFKKIDANEPSLLAGTWGAVVGEGPGIGGR